jgi:photosystem II stability/assembly factor-like uncharacterized protein
MKLSDSTSLSRNYAYQVAQIAVAILFVTCLAPLLGQAQQDPSLFSGMQWRQIGPFRAGRVSAVAGIAGNPAVYYIGTPGGGVWQTTDGGMVWKPISDSVHVASIGAIVVAPSNPQIIYFGTGDVSEVGGSVNQGDGVYKSIDGGKTWHHMGLGDSWHIGAMWIDPRNPDTVFVAALGHTFATSEQRGIFKTTDGGANWKKVLYKDDKTAAIDVVFDAADPKIGFAALWGHYVQPGGRASVLNGSGGGTIYKTTDEGETWTPITGNGLPTGDLGRIGVAVSQNGRRVFAIIAGQQGSTGGLYRSDDGGTTWQRSTTDPRVTGSGYFSKVYMDPKNSDVVYVMQTSMYRSIDGGHNFISFKGAPGGDDNHVLWIDPTNSNWIIMGSDQGATISLDAGNTWSTWYNQPTGQVYHLSTDNRFPYWVYGTQQDSGSVGTLSRGDYGAITFLDWDPVGAYEFGYIVPDPLNPNFVYAGGPARGLVRVDRTNRQTRNISPNVSRDGDYRTAVNPPLMFSPLEPHALYWGTQYLMGTLDGGATWHRFSPDLTVRPDAPQPPPTPPATPTPQAESLQPPPNRAAINAFSISPKQLGVIWAGTTNGQVQLTQDAGKHWNLVSPTGLIQYVLISSVEASHTDPSTAYISVDAHETNDFRPHIFRTRDFGKSWQETNAGIPAGDGSFVRVVREDPVRKGLLYAGTENGVYVSFDDGDHWQSLQFNLPTSSVRDLTIRNNDLVACTYGRAFWILDDISPLRRVAQSGKNILDSDAMLFPLQTAIRVRLNDNQDTPFPPEMPSGTNPPTGAILYYYLKAAPAGDITIGIYTVGTKDAPSRLVRELSSVPEPPLNEPPPNVPTYWLAAPRPLSKNAGTNRAFWDLRYTAPLALRHDYAISALPAETPADPRGPLVAPGAYEVRLTVNGKTFRQQLHVEPDPRVKLSPDEFKRQSDFSISTAARMSAAFEGHRVLQELRDAIADREKSLQNDDQAKSILDALKEFDRKVTVILGTQSGRGGGGGAGAGNGVRPKPTFNALNGNYASLLSASDGADGAPTEAMSKAADDYCVDYVYVVSQWDELRTKELPALNAQLAARKLQPLPTNGTFNTPICIGLIVPEIPPKK